MRGLIVNRHAVSRTRAPLGPCLYAFICVRLLRERDFAQPHRVRAKLRLRQSKDTNMEHGNTEQRWLRLCGVLGGRLGGCKQGRQVNLGGGKQGRAHNSVGLNQART
jgi:hypothetical protein